MAARVVRYDPKVQSLGLDHHDGLFYVAILNGSLAPFAPPYIPVPAPFYASMHGVIAPIDYSWLKDMRNPKIFADNACIVSAEHTALHTIHIPMGVNVLTPVIVYLGEANWKLGVSSVVTKVGAVASTIGNAFGLTLNCADPVSMPLSAYWSPSTVHVSPTVGDFVVVAADWVLSEALNLVTQAGLKWVGKGVSKRIGSRPLGKKGAKLLKDAGEKAVDYGKRVPVLKAVCDGAIENVKTLGQKKVEKFLGDGSKSVFEAGEKEVLPEGGHKKGLKMLYDDAPKGS